jgi:hypothetical protein
MKFKRLALVLLLVLLIGSVVGCSNKSPSDGTDVNNDNNNNEVTDPNTQSMINWWTTSQLAAYGANGLPQPLNTEIVNINDNRVSLAKLDENGYRSYISEMFNILQSNNTKLYKLNGKNFDGVTYDASTINTDANEYYYKVGEKIYKVNFDHKLSGISSDRVFTLEFNDVTSKFGNGYTFK